MTKILNKDLADKAVAETTTLLKEHGIEHFILLFQPVPGLTTSHLENMRVKDALAVLITGFKETVKLELQLNPNSPPKYQAALIELLQNIQILIKETNQKIDTIKEIPKA